LSPSVKVSTELTQPHTHLQVWLHPNTLAGIEAFAPVLDLLEQG
jgi:hypothetical protein